MNMPKYTTEDIETLLTKSGLPHFPQVVSKIDRLITSDEATFTEVAALIDSDLALRIGVTKAANSPLYKMVNHVDSTYSAVKALGLNRIRDILYTFALKSVIPPSSGMDISDFWKDSVRIALFSKNIAERYDEINVSRFFTLGILSNCGFLVKLVLFPEETAEHIKHSKAEGFTRAASESADEMPNDSELTVACLNYWGFEETICNPILLANRLEPTDGEFRKQADILNIAYFMNNLHFHSTYKLSHHERDCSNNAMTRLKFDSQDSSDILKTIHPELEAYVNLLA